MASHTARLNTALKGRYRIERELGEGGMATVFLAHDERHDRSVALKVLKPELAAVVGAERFLAEIKTTANLQHPHILPLFDSGEADSFLFYVMPYVEGESLRDRLDREKQLPVDEAVRIASDVADALQSAHEQGVIHRDIKPANILLSRGRPLVADFGIALAVSAAGGGRLTETGLSIGTPYYMSPEQATADRDPDPRSDMYSLGCVLYEMLVGEPPYTGGSAQAVLAKILTGDAPASTEARPAIPANVDAAIRRALERVPADRFATAQRFAEALADSGFRHGKGHDLAPAERRRAPMAVAGLVGLAMGVLVGSWALGPNEVALPVVRFSVALARDQEIDPQQGINVAISPDGSWLAFRGRAQLWRRSLDDVTLEPIPGTEEGRNPAISPDGRSIAFAALGSLKVVSLEGGPARTVVEEGVPGGLGGIDWGPDQALYFTDEEGSLFRVPVTGGEPQRLTTNEPGTHHAWVETLPGGEGVLFTIVRGTRPELSEIAALSLSDGEVRTLMPGTIARYAETGHLVVAAADGALMGAPFDLDALRMEGPAVGLGEEVIVYNGSATQLAWSEAGTLLYELPPQPTESVPVWVTRQGDAREIDPSLRIRLEDYTPLSISPDGKRLAFATEEGDGRVTLWVKELDDGAETRLASEGTHNYAPRWSADGLFVSYVSNRNGQEDVWRQPSDASGQAALVLDREEEVYEAEFSRDGEWVVFRQNASSIADILAISTEPDAAPVPVAAAPQFGEHSLALSPDDRWLAYVSNSSGSDEVYVKRFLDSESPVWTVSTNGGTEPVWARDGEELFFRDAAGRLVAAEVTGVSEFSVERRHALFSTEGFVSSDAASQSYDVAPDHQRFVMLRPIADPPENQLVVIHNFIEVLRLRAPN